MSDVQIRPATIADLPILVEFQQRLAFESENITLDVSVLRKGMEALFSDTAKGAYYVADLEGQPVGCHMITYEWSDWRNGVVYWLQSVYVKEQFRQLGVFKKMFEVLKTRIQQDDSVKGLRLYVDKTNLRAQKVYAAMGMNGDHYSVFEMMK
jgi:ribosomal protein S18 acetylase RimI-like enzyme